MRSVPLPSIGDDYEAKLQTSSASYPDQTFDPEAGLVILYTSSKTGLPKGALNSHRAMIARGLCFSSLLKIPDGETFIAWTPLFHMVAVFTWVMSCVAMKMARWNMLIVLNI